MTVASVSPSPERWRDSLTRAGSSPEEIASVSYRTCRNINREPANIARRAAIARSLRGLGLSYPETAEAIGYRSHTTVIALLRRFP